MQIEVRRSAPFQRFVLSHQGRIWDGETWSKKPRKPLLFASTEDAFAEQNKLEPEIQRQTTVSLFSVPVDIHIVSSWPFDIEEMRKFLERQIEVHFGGMEGAPEDAEASFVALGRWAIRQRRKWPDSKDTHPVTIEVPLYVRLLAREEVELARLSEWLKRHVRIEADDLTPKYVPVVVQQVSAAWRKAKVVDVGPKR